jgi:hypothetical protein
MMSVFNQGGGDTSEETACFYRMSTAGVQSVTSRSPKKTPTAATNYETPTTPLIYLALPKTLNYSIMKPRATQRVIRHLPKISASPQGNCHAYCTTNSYLTENGRCSG